MNLKEMEERLKALEGVEKRLKVMEDIEEIKQMHIKYILALNHQNFEEMIEYFTEDAKFEYVDHHAKLEGKEEIAKFFRAMAENMRKRKAWKGGQILIHPVISVDGDTGYRYLDLVSSDGRWRSGSNIYFAPGIGNTNDSSSAGFLYDGI